MSHSMSGKLAPVADQKLPSATVLPLRSTENTARVYG